MSGKWCPERIQEVSRTSGYSALGPFLVDKLRPESRSWDQWGAKMVTKIEKMERKKHLKIDAEKVLKIMV